MIGTKHRCWAVAVLSIAAAATAQETPRVTVLSEEDVYTFVSPDNGSGPLWSYGCTSIARLGDDVVVSQMETGEGVPLLCNTRWRLLRRTAGQWRLIDRAEAFRQREPCSLAITSATDLFLYANDSTQPPGTKYGPCKPHLLHFAFHGKECQRTPIFPAWEGTPHFTDHSYRGYASDPGRGQLLMLNIDAETSVQNACLLAAAGETLANGSITFPIRACYPQVALNNGAVHVLAVGDIVEPVEAWRQYKYEQTGRKWDYVFRILYLAWTPNLTQQGFGKPLEIANVDPTGGHIANNDLWVSPGGTAYILYTEREVQSALLRDKFFPGKSIVNSLKLAIVKDGALLSTQVLVPGSPEQEPGNARFHVTPDGCLYAVIDLRGPGGGNKLLRVYPPLENATLVPIPLQKPMGGFSLASQRAGNPPSYTIDLLGQSAANTMSYAEIQIQPPARPDTS